MVNCESNTSSAGAPGATLPKIDEAHDLVGLLGLGNARMGIAQDRARGIAGQEDQDALLTAATAGNIVFFQWFSWALAGTVWKSRSSEAPRQPGARHFVEPGGHAAAAGATIDPRTVSRQVRAFGHHIETREQGDALVRDQIHDMAFAFLADEFEGQERAHGLLGGNRLRTGQLGLTRTSASRMSAHQRHEEQQAAEPSAEGSRLQAQRPDIGHGGRIGSGGGAVPHRVVVANGRNPPRAGGW